jgi:DNA-binding XRE family transcriptional regulator
MIFIVCRFIVYIKYIVCSLEPKFYIMDIKIHFGKKIREIRKKLWYSQEHLASISKLHRTYISAIERWEQNVSIDNIKKISDALQVRIYDLFDF